MALKLVYVLACDVQLVGASLPAVCCGECGLPMLLVAFVPPYDDSG